MIRVLFFFLLLASPSFASSSRHLTVFAEPNMTMALTKIARIYSQKSNAIISVNFASAQDALNEVESGEPIDIFISAHPAGVESLRQKGLADIHNIGYIARDNLVLVTSKSNPALPKEFSKQLSLEESLKILNYKNNNLILDNEGNTSGKFCSDFLKNHSFDNLQTFSKLIDDKSPILKIVESNNSYYALLLQSQVKNEENLLILATKSSENIFYQALVIAGDNMEIAREFLKFLKSETAKEILKENGFVVD